MTTQRRLLHRRTFRLNVLVLAGLGYSTILIMFTAMTWKGGLSADVAYDVIEGPLMALIGGSIAIAKDLISVDRFMSEQGELPEQANSQV